MFNKINIFFREILKMQWFVINLFNIFIKPLRFVTVWNSEKKVKAFFHE